MIETETPDGIGVIRLNRPDRGNALTESMLVEISAAIEELGASESVRACPVPVVAAVNGPADSGLADQVVEVPVVIDACRQVIEAMTGSVPRPVVTETLRAVRGASVQDLAASLRQAAKAQARLMATSEHQARIAACLPGREGSNPDMENSGAL